MKELITAKSSEMYERAKNVIAGGASSAAQTPLEGHHPYPLFVQRAKGSRLWDVDDNEYIDYLQALGPTMVGHANEKILKFVCEEINKGTAYGLPFELQIEVAEKLVKHVPSFERVSFMNSGTEVVQMALRLARAYSGKNVIVKFEGNYHGWVDSVAHSVHPSIGEPGKDSSSEIMPIGKGIPKNAYRDMIVVRWNNLKEFEQVIQKNRDSVGGVLLDPCMCNSGIIPPEKGYLEAIREITQRYGMVLIFDEVITGFRLSLGGAQQKFGVVPDLTTLAKAVGGGFPVAVYGGREEIMKLIEKGNVFRAGTLNANRVAMAAAYATLNFLEEDGAKVYKQIYRLGERLISGIEHLIKNKSVKAIVQGFGPMFQVHFTPLKKISDYDEFCMSDKHIYDDFRKRLLARGVLIRPSHFGELYLSAAHTEDDIAKTLKAIESSFDEMRADNII